jgi:catalase
LLAAAGISGKVAAGAAGVVAGDSGGVDGLIETFIAAVARHRHFERETDPPVV